MGALNKRDDLTAQHFLVGFLDLVGQKGLLSEMAGRRLEDVDAAEVRTLVRRTYGALRGFRKTIYDYCETVEQPVIDLSALPEEQRQEFRRLVAGRVYRQPLSDAMVVYVPLAEDGALSINGAYTALGATAAAILGSLAAGCPCRGGIDVGWAAEINDGEVYGPALYSAYKLESRAAKQPRIAVGAGLLDYITAMQNLPGHDDATRAARKTAGLCGLLVGWDVDGQAIVDYLGDGYREILSAEMRRRLATEVLPRAYKFVAAEQRRFCETQDTKHAQRYEALLSYFNSRLPLWKKEGWQPETCTVTDAAKLSYHFR